MMAIFRKEAEMTGYSSLKITDFDTAPARPENRTATMLIATILDSSQTRWMPRDQWQALADRTCPDIAAGEAVGIAEFSINTFPIGLTNNAPSKPGPRSKYDYAIVNGVKRTQIPSHTVAAAALVWFLYSPRNI
jgi:hypothetical protein